MLINSRYDVRTIKLKENSNLDLFEICSVMTGGIRYHQITAATFPCEEMGGPSRPRPPGPTARLNKIHFDLIIFQ